MFMSAKHRLNSKFCKLDLGDPKTWGPSASSRPSASTQATPWSSVHRVSRVQIAMCVSNVQTNENMEPLDICLTRIY